MEASPKHHLTYEQATLEELLERNEHGSTGFHIAASSGLLERIQKKFLTQENLTLQDNKGDNVIFRAAIFKFLHRIPRFALTRELVIQPNLNKETVLHHATVKDQLHLIPVKLLEPKDFQAQDKNGITPLLKMTLAGASISKVHPSLISEEALLQNTKAGNVLNNLAKFGNISQLPSKFQNPRYLTKPLFQGKSPLQTAINSKRLAWVEETLLASCIENSKKILTDSEKEELQKFFSENPDICRNIQHQIRRIRMIRTQKTFKIETI